MEIFKDIARIVICVGVGWFGVILAVWLSSLIGLDSILAGFMSLTLGLVFAAGSAALWFQDRRDYDDYL